jgi:hypothetical protein
MVYENFLDFLATKNQLYICVVQSEEVDENSSKRETKVSTTFMLHFTYLKHENELMVTFDMQRR